MSQPKFATPEQIEKRAYELYLESGCADASISVQHPDPETLNNSRGQSLVLEWKPSGEQRRSAR